MSLQTRNTRRSLRASVPCFVQCLQPREDGNHLILECRVDGYPRPDIRWEKSGKPMGNSRRIHMTRTGNRCLLQIKMPCCEDVGTYDCIATNNVGTTHSRTSFEGVNMQKTNITTSTNSLKPAKQTEIRTRSRERSAESVINGRIPRSVSPCRSPSVPRKTRQELSMSKPSSFDNDKWNKSDDREFAFSNETRDEFTNVHKKQLSKSVEDCRRNKRSFLNRVKIPEIFSSSKVSDVEAEVLHRVKMSSKNGENLTNGEVPQSVKSFVKSKNVRKDIKSNGSDTANGKISEEQVQFQLTTRERIAAYLKRLDNSYGLAKSKELRNESNGIFKRNAASEKNRPPLTERKNSDKDCNFFSKFRRRKSSDNNKKPSEIVKCKECIPKNGGKYQSNLSLEIPTYKECSSQKTTGLAIVLHSNGTIQSDDCDEQLSDIIDLTTKPEERISIGEMMLDVTKTAADSSPCDMDLGSFKSIDVALMNSFEDFEKSKTSPAASMHHDRFDRQVISQESPCPKSSKSVCDTRNCLVPQIRIELSPEDNDDIQLSDPENILTTDNTVEDHNEKEKNTDDLFSKTSKGKIKYCSSLIEEECEVFLEDGSQKAITPETDLQRISPTDHFPGRIVKGPQSVTILRGESFTLAACFDGHPKPLVVWMKGGRVLENDDRLSILESGEMSVVTVSEVTADDSGKYVVHVENQGGGDSCFASVAVVGFPEPPGGEPNVSEVTDHSLVLSWYGSMYDGGSVVTGYKVEMCTLPDKNYYTVASSVNTSCSVLGLSKGQRYTFRVRAENRYGISQPSKESKVIRLDDFLKEDTSSDEDPGEEPSIPISIESGAIFSEKYELKEEVGKGRFGTVYRCVETSSGRPRAAKVIRCLKIKDKEKVRQEIEIMSRLHHPKLMQVLAAFESGRNMIMVMEFISGGELFERVIADDFVLTEHDCILFMRQICTGVSYMHKNDVIHLDLKPENILCKTRTSHKIKIIDFGLARVYKSDESLRVLFGTPEFVAPEIINYEPVGPASDMWSVGVICYVLLSGLSPFMGDSDTETFSNITRGEMDFDDEAFDDISQDAKDFISKLLVKQVRFRLSAEECLKHPWLSAGSLQQKRPLSTEKLKRFIIRRKWQKSGTAIRALGRMVSLSRSSLNSSCDSPVGSPTSSRSRSSLLSRSETTESGESDVFSDLKR